MNESRPDWYERAFEAISITRYNERHPPPDIGVRGVGNGGGNRHEADAHLARRIVHHRSAALKSQEHAQRMKLHRREGRGTLKRKESP